MNTDERELLILLEMQRSLREIEYTMGGLVLVGVGILAHMDTKIAQGVTQHLQTTKPERPSGDAA